MTRASALPIPHVVPRSDKSVSVLDTLLTHKALLLLVTAIGFEMVMPILIWKRIIPGVSRWAGDLAVLTMLAVTFVQMLQRDHIPRMVVVFGTLSVISTAVAAFEGQPLVGIAWGWWMMFKYPIVGIYVYIHSEWPDVLSRWVYNFCFLALGLQVLVQVGQYATGEVLGDNLAGTFGAHGVNPLVMFIFITTCLAFGYWLVKHEWRMLACALFMGAISSGLGIMRIYPFGAIAIAGLALIIYFGRGGKLLNMLLYLALLAILLVGFAAFYNAVIAEERGVRRIEQFLAVGSVDNYLNTVNYDEDTGQFRLGRSFALSYGWSLLQRDSATMLWGYGIGARNESSSLGIVGVGLEDSEYGLAIGTSALVFMQEFGLLGLAILGSVFLWTGIVCWRVAQRNQDPYIQTMAYGILLFTLCWPLWFWYNHSWRFAVPMLMYFSMVGYLMGKYYGFDQSKSSDTF